jgi:Flp pilus assembly protein TadB
MSDNVKENIKSHATWLRALFMLLFVFIFNLAEVVLAAVVVFQLLVVIFTGQPNARLLRFGRDLGTFIYQIVRFLTYNSDEQPFPFGDWPEAPPT